MSYYYQAASVLSSCELRETRGIAAETALGDLGRVLVCLLAGCGHSSFFFCNNSFPLCGSRALYDASKHWAGGRRIETFKNTHAVYDMLLYDVPVSIYPALKEHLHIFRGGVTGLVLAPHAVAYQSITMSELTRAKQPLPRRSRARLDRQSC